MARALFIDPDTEKIYRTRSGYVFDILSEDVHDTYRDVRERKGQVHAIAAATGRTLLLTALFPVCYIASFDDLEKHE